MSSQHAGVLLRVRHTLRMGPDPCRTLGGHAFRKGTHGVINGLLALFLTNGLLSSGLLLEVSLSLLKPLDTCLGSRHLAECPGLSRTIPSLKGCRMFPLRSFSLGIGRLNATLDRIHLAGRYFLPA